jgi:hypothetical protein
MWVLASKAVPGEANRVADASASPTSKEPVAGADCGDRRRHGENVFARAFALRQICLKPVPSRVVWRSARGRAPVRKRRGPDADREKVGACLDMCLLRAGAERCEQALRRPSRRPSQHP